MAKTKITPEISGTYIVQLDRIAEAKNVTHRDHGAWEIACIEKGYERHCQMIARGQSNGA